MLTLHCSSFPEARLPKSPDEYLRAWRNRPGLRNSLTSEALTLLEKLGKDRVMVCENAPLRILSFPI